MRILGEQKDAARAVVRSECPICHQQIMKMPHKNRHGRFKYFCYCGWKGTRPRPSTAAFGEPFEMRLRRLMRRGLTPKIRLKGYDRSDILDLPHHVIAEHDWWGRKWGRYDGGDGFMWRRK